MKYTFPNNFKFSCASSAYQIEGGAREDGKGPSIMDLYTTIPGINVDNSNANISCDSYHKYKEDVQMLKFLGVQQYRMSLSWSRILPDGTLKNINQSGIDYYNNLINELVTNNIEPLVNLYFWDLPQSLMDLGGFLNPKIIDWFGDYARLCFSKFGDRIKKWITFNEPQSIAMNGYGSGKSFVIAPGNFKNIHSCWTKYLAGHNLLLAHAKAYRIYESEFKGSQKGEVGIAINGIFPEPLTNHTEDVEACRRCHDFTWGWFAHPIFRGNYPKRMIDTIGKRSQSEGRITSRLPEFTKEEIEFIKGTADFIGLNYYTSGKVRSRYPEEYTPDRPADILDGGYKVSVDSRWKQNNPPNGWIFLYPEGLRKQLNQFRTDYGNPKIIITENGCMDTQGEWLNDVSRIEYIREHMIAVSKAIQDGCNVVGYTVWSLMDSFEWWDGFQAKFGLYHVDFNDPNRKRTPKASALWYKNVIKKRAIEPDDSFVNSKI